MPYIAALPRLRFLMCQDTEASDEGFVALSRSRTLEHLWGRRCYVDDEGLSALPRFPALRELMPMDVPDEGYRHIGRRSPSTPAPA